ncbi:hypothetical protein HYG81_18920 [Natrinema zhouii]|uniref:hypothetical protein n=1 Tax=Natrinema zhouii TaxID=1710539 RepID=UPI001D000E55|nr:hypothetical protein [Natrinema zhouii]UHQ97936.1 hypothetical protein HYG81_18920 [Natrinema zhouii]
MTTGTRSDTERDTEPDATRGPEISVCESGPDKVVFIESGNTEGWISSDRVVETTR